MAAGNGNRTVVLYNGHDLVAFEMGDEEKRKCNKFRRECTARLKNLRLREPGTNAIESIEMKYGSEIGFFQLYFERGSYQLLEGFPEPDCEKAFGLILYRAASRVGFDMEVAQRDKLVAVWPFKSEYDGRVYAFEFIIAKFYEAESCQTEQIITDCTKYLNLWFKKPHWRFDHENRRFYEIPGT